MRPISQLTEGACRLDWWTAAPVYPHRVLTVKLQKSRHSLLVYHVTWPQELLELMPLRRREQGQAIEAGWKISLVHASPLLLEEGARGCLGGTS